ncbi:MAG: hypothetical protein V6Z81_09025 [Parvularculales bacterium]
MAGAVSWAGRRIGRMMARYLSRHVRHYRPFSITSPEKMRRVLQTGDVLLVEGKKRISTAIKYLTQSTWSHAALYVGEDVPGVPLSPEGERLCLIEVDLQAGSIASPLSKYADFNTRICRPVGLPLQPRLAVARYMLDNLGLTYDLRNIVDLARYLLPIPPVPSHWRQRMLAFGSGEPTQAICSSLIARAFHSVHYPVLPFIEKPETPKNDSHREVLHVAHHSLFVPRDFDLSPYFAVVKPTIETGFDYESLPLYGWEKRKAPALPEN